MPKSYSTFNLNASVNISVSWRERLVSDVFFKRLGLISWYGRLCLVVQRLVYIPDYFYLYSFLLQHWVATEEREGGDEREIGPHHFSNQSYASG